MRIEAHVGFVLWLFLTANVSAGSDWQRATQRALGAPAPVQVQDVLAAAGGCSREQRELSPCGPIIKTSELRHGLLRYEIEPEKGHRDLTLLAYEGVVLSAYRWRWRSRRWLHFHDEGWREVVESAFPGERVGAVVSSSSVKPKEAHAVLELLGILAWNEYGFICEYDTAGSPPRQRSAAMLLAKRERTDLLSALLHGPNPVGQVYAADTLLLLESMGLGLASRDASKIDCLRKEPVPIWTCGNGGSYKIYPGTSSEVLTDKVIAELPLWWDFLRDLGYP